MADKQELEGKIKKYEIALTGASLPASAKPAVEKKLEDAKRELKELLEKEGDAPKVAEKEVHKIVKEEKKEAKKEEHKEEHKPAGKRGRPSKPHHEHKPAHKTPAKKVVAKKAVAKKEPAHKAGAHVNKASGTVTIDGVEYNVEKCNEAVEAWEAKRESNREAGKRFVKKSSGTQVGEKLSSAGEKVLASIKKVDAEKKPAFYAGKLRRLSELMTEIATLIDELVKDKQTSKEVKTFATEIKDYIKKHLSAKK